ncbi:hypothetical protein GJ496_000040 [Pomphorhynchus laevis]|nr:hypothetical protein GJ496_000040 [Pomphorhynchus laevis]
MSVQSDKLLKAIASRKSRTTKQKYPDIISKLRLTISIRIAKSASICIIRSTRNAGFTTEELAALRNRRLGTCSGRTIDPRVYSRPILEDWKDDMTKFGFKS